VPKGRRPKNDNGQAAAKKNGFEATLWAAADKLRGNMDAAEYKHVALGLIFLKYISDRFEERWAEILAEPDTPDYLKKELRKTVRPTPLKMFSGCRRRLAGIT
jgi:type I restriction enzyme M protein